MTLLLCLFPMADLPASAQSAPPVAANTPQFPTLEIAKRVEPEYSPEARKAKLQGTVLLSLTVQRDGTVSDARVRRGLGFGLDEQAIAAAKQWQYKPYESTRESVETPVEIRFKFASSGPWSIDGFSFAFHAPLQGPIEKPVMTRYAVPKPASCTQDLRYIPVDMTVGVDGKTADVRVAPTTESRVARVVIDAAQSWRFRPGKAAGNAVPTTVKMLLGCDKPEAGDAAEAASYKVGNGVTAPSIIFKVDPEYSEQARKAKYNGTVTLGIVVDTEGRARDIRVTKAIGMGLDEEATAAVMQWRFKPGKKDGQPVSTHAVVEVNFRLL